MVQAANGGEYRVHKFFEGEDVPDQTYVVSTKNNKLTCNCPSGTYRGYCKHLNMVKRYQELEKKSDIIPTLIIEGF